MHWENIKHISNKIASRLALLRRVRRYLTEDSAKLLANALILPYYDYCCSAWTNCNQGVKDTLIKQHKQMARVVLQTDILTPTTEMFRRLKWIDMEKRWQFQKSKLMFDTLNDNAPSYLQDLFTSSASTHRYSTRNAESRGLIVPKAKTENERKAFSFEGAIIWNNLPSGVRNAQTKQTFCNHYLKMFKR